MRGRPASSEGESRAIPWPRALRRALAGGGVLLASGILVLALGSPATGASCPATASVPEKTLEPLDPSLVSGDPNFAGHGPAVTVAAKRKHIASSTDSLIVVVRMRAEETTSDWTTAEGQQTFPLYTAPPGCHIVLGSASRGPFDSNGYLAGAATSDPYSLTPGDTDTLNPSFVRGYRIWADHSGDDVPTYTSVRVLTRAFSVRLRD